jgi:hypothetical protein
MELTKLIARLVSVQKCTERTKTVRNDSGTDLLVLRVATPGDTFQGRSQFRPSAGAVLCAEFAGTGKGPSYCFVKIGEADMSHCRKRNPPAAQFNAYLSGWAIAFTALLGTLLRLSLHSTLNLSKMWARYRYSERPARRTRASQGFIPVLWNSS